MSPFSSLLKIWIILINMTVTSSTAHAMGPKSCSSPDNVSVPSSAAPIVAGSTVFSSYMKSIQSIRIDSPIHTVAFTSDGKKILIGTLQRLAILELGKKTITLLEGHSGLISSAAISLDGTMALTGSYDHTAKLWNLETGEVIDTLSGHPSAITSVAFSPDGTRALVGFEDGMLKIWNIVTGEVLTLVGHTHSIKAIAISLNGRRAYTGSRDGTVKIWNLISGTLIHSLNENTQVESIAISADGTKALTGSHDHTLKIWDLRTREVVRKILTGVVLSIAISPDGTKALTGILGGAAKVWDLETGELLGSFIENAEGVFSVAISPDGRKALTGSNDNTLRIWEFNYAEREKILALTSASSKKLGEKSPAHTLPVEIFKRIAEFTTSGFEPSKALKH